MVWQFVAGVALALVSTLLIRPKVPSQGPAGLEDIQAPVAEEGREIPVLFGCRMLRGPNVVWYGDFKSQAIKAKGGKK